MASAEGRRDEATDGGRDSGGASSVENRTAEVARETRAADGGTRGGGAAFLRCEKTSDRPEAAAATPDASPPNSATRVASALHASIPFLAEGPPLDNPGPATRPGVGSDTARAAYLKTYPSFRPKVTAPLLPSNFWPSK